MHPITETINSIIGNTPDYSIEMFLQDINKNEVEQSSERWVTMTEAMSYSTKARTTLFFAIKNGFLKGSRGRTKKSFLDEWILTGAKSGVTRKKQGGTK
jgi:hypothetical protein